MGAHPSRCTYVNPSTRDACDDWTEDGDRCATHARRPPRTPAPRPSDEDQP